MYLFGESLSSKLYRKTKKNSFLLLKICIDTNAFPYNFSLALNIYNFMEEKNFRTRSKCFAKKCCKMFSSFFFWLNLIQLDVFNLIWCKFKNCIFFSWYQCVFISLVLPRCFDIMSKLCFFFCNKKKIKRWN